MAKNIIKKNSLVIVIVGKDKGKSGRVLDFDKKTNKVKVENVCMLTKHYKAKKSGEVSSIKKVEGYIDISNRSEERSVGKECREEWGAKK